MIEDEKYHGHMTMADGTHITLSGDEVAALLEQFRIADERDDSDMPDSISAVRLMERARNRLSRLGWQPASYCPKDGSAFAVMEAGSTGIFRAWFTGKWPYDFINLGDGSVHPHGALWKALDKLTPAEAALLAECEQYEREWLDRLAESMISIEATP